MTHSVFVSMFQMTYSFIIKINITSNILFDYHIGDLKTDQFFMSG
jgi:hypothetical protein